MWGRMLRVPFHILVSVKIYGCRMFTVYILRYPESLVSLHATLGEPYLELALLFIGP
jgi:hypothetical protein